jgi:hypothetical protein
VVSRKLDPQLVADGSGGVLVIWDDFRAGPSNGDIYASRILGNATRAPGFSAGGQPLSTASDNEARPRACTDGAGGALVAWEDLFSANDTDIHGARINSAGIVVFSVAITLTVSDSRAVSVASDDAGGFYTVYQDSSASGFRIFGAHTSGTGFGLLGATKISNSPYSFSAKKTPHIAPDGNGGVFAAWLDNVNGLFDVDLMRFGPNLQYLPDWYDLGSPGYGGVNLVSQDFSLLPDGTGGCFAAWNTAALSKDIYLVHAAPNRSGYSQWTDLGVTASYDGAPPALASDGSGGVIVVANTTAQRITSNGSTAIRWPYAGVTFNGSVASYTAAVSDGAHGVIAGWSDPHITGAQPAGYTVFAAHIDRFGALGLAAPTIASVKDAPKDQGGHVRLVWNAGYLDSDPSYEVNSYWIWRQTPAAAAAAAVRAGARWVASGADVDARAATPGRLFAPSAAQGFAWEYLATQNANASAQYSYIAPTTLDSTGSSNPRTVFMVEAHSAWSPAFWGSNPDSGYSVDNIPPVTPAPFTAQYTVGSTRLHWGRNLEADLAGYRLYRGTSLAFVPNGAGLVAALPDTGYVDIAGAPYIYKLTAIDVHGNESPASVVVPAGTLGVDPRTVPRELAFAAPVPNPASTAATLRFALPQGSQVQLRVYDASGRLMRELARDARDAGEYTVAWDLRDDAARRVEPGLYFARLDVAGRVLVRRVAVLR